MDKFNIPITQATGKPGFSLYSRTTKNLELEQVAEEFEAMFVSQMLKQAYDTKLADGLFDSSAKETYQTLLNQELGRKLASKSNFGIADALKMQFK